MSIKLLLRCTKDKPYLVHEQGDYDYDDMCCGYNCYSLLDRQDLYNDGIPLEDTLNGKFLVECEFEIEPITYGYLGNTLNDFYGMQLHTKTLTETGLIIESQFQSLCDLRKYLLRREEDYIAPLEVGYAIYLKNIEFLDKPKFLGDLWVYDKQGLPCEVTRATEMQKVHMINWMNVNEYYPLNVTSKQLVSIINRKQTMVIRRRVPKTMLTN